VERLSNFSAKIEVAQRTKAAVNIEIEALRTSILVTEFDSLAHIGNVRRLGNSAKSSEGDHHVLLVVQCSTMVRSRS